MYLGLLVIRYGKTCVDRVMTVIKTEVFSIPHLSWKQGTQSTMPGPPWRSSRVSRETEGTRKIWARTCISVSLGKSRQGRMGWFRVS